MPSFAATFTVNNKDYDVISCTFSFSQASDEKGRPASDVHSGHISLEIPSSEESDLASWMIDPYKKQNGSIVFNKIDQASKMKELKFEDGYLVAYSESFNEESSQPMTTSLSISARKISIGDATHEASW